jgi:hypothetical protein
MRPLNHQLEPSTEPKEKPSLSPCPVEAIVTLWNDVMSIPPFGLPRVRVISDPLRKAISARWREDAERQALAWWRFYFTTEVGGSDFLLGKAGDGRFRADLEWVVGPKNFGKIMNGRYLNAPTGPGGVPAIGGRPSAMRAAAVRAKGGTDVDRGNGAADAAGVDAVELGQDAAGGYALRR